MECFTGTIIPWTLNYVPVDWAFCNGALVSVQQYPALFAVIGSRFGGDGRTNFQLPNLCGRTIVGSNSPKNAQVTIGGTESVILNIGNIPSHNHMLKGNTNTKTAGSNIPDDSKVLGIVPPPAPKTPAILMYDTYSGNTSDLTSFDLTSISPSGNGGAHSNLQPYLVLNYIICLNGVFPVTDS